MKKKEHGKNWTTESLVIFGLWLLEKRETGYGLLCIHGSVLGIKIGALLKLKWKDFIDPNTDECYLDLYIEDDKLVNNISGSRELNHFIKRITQFQFNNNDNKDKSFKYEDFIYTKAKTGQQLNTSTLNRELQKFQSEFRQQVYELTLLDLNLKDLKSNAFEIAWARDLVNYYARSKKAFIAVSKFMGHRTLKHTIDLLELQPNDEIILRFNLFDPSVENEIKLSEALNNKEWLTRYLINKNIAELSKAFEDARDKSRDEYNDVGDLE